MTLRVAFAHVRAKPPRPREAIRAALEMLHQAHQYAVETKRHRWQFAVEIAELLNLGVTRSELRWLMAMGLVAHAWEIVQKSAPARTFTGLGMLTFCRSSCFVLSDKVIENLARQRNGILSPNIFLGLLRDSESPPRTSPQGDAAQVASLPEWDPQRRELRVGEYVIKRFRGRANNQELIIRAFHEESWAFRIDDPLPPAPGRDPRRILNDTIKGLNRYQKNHWLTFRGDGTGRGVLWELRDCALDEL